MIKDPIIYKFFKDFTNHRKETNRMVVFSCRPYSNIPKYTTDETFQQSGREDPLDAYWRVQLVWKKVQANSFLEPPLEYNQDKMPLINHCDFFNHLGSYRNIMQFQIS